MTTAAQVSSAEHSRARTVNKRRVRRPRGRQRRPIDNNIIVKRYDDTMATLGRRSHDTRPPSPLPPPAPDVFSDDTPRAPARIPSDEGSLAAPAPQKRLAMFTEMLSSGTSSLARGPAQLLPGSRSHTAHSRADSQLRENAGSPAPVIMMTPSTSGGGPFSTSPSKVAILFYFISFCLFFCSRRHTSHPHRIADASIRFLCASFRI